MELFIEKSCKIFSYWESLVKISIFSACFPWYNEKNSCNGGSMERQRRLAVVNDLTGFGRCSLAVQLPLVSALRVQACPLPTAILSVHTGFPSHVLDDYTARMRPYMENWKENGISFDGILTGFIGSAEQIGIVIDCIEMFREKDKRKRPHLMRIGFTSRSLIR